MVDFYIAAHAIPEAHVTITSYDDMDHWIGLMMTLSLSGPSCESVNMVAKLII